jgi:hypothetical protein
MMNAGHGGQTLVSGRPARPAANALPGRRVARVLGEYHVQGPAAAASGLSAAASKLRSTFPALRTATH